MANATPLTQQDLLQALAQLETRLGQKFATKDDLQQLATKADLQPFVTKGDLQQLATKDDLKNLATKVDLVATESHLKDYVQQAADGVLKTVDTLHAQTGKRLDKIEAELKTTNRRLLGLEHDTVSKKEFAELKARVDAHHPLN